MNMNIHKSLDKLDFAIEKLQLASLIVEEERLERLKVDCVRCMDWAQWYLCLKKFVYVRSQKQSLKRKLDLHQEKLRFQQRLQEQHGDSKLIILHEYNPDVNSVRIRFEIISKHVNAQNESTSLVPFMMTFKKQIVRNVMKKLLKHLVLRLLMILFFSLRHLM